MNWTRSFLAVFPVLAILPLATLASLFPVDLRTESLVDAVGIDTPKPRLSWRVDSGRRAQHQTARHILVASRPDLLEANTGDLWDSGKVTDGETLHIEYGGRPLASGQVCHWKVRVWDQDGVDSGWSLPATWTMGVLRPEDWTAQWIAFRDDTPLHTRRDTLHLPPARHYRQSFLAHRPVKRALLHATALGLVELHLNARRVGDALFEPGWADYHQRGYYRTHDVTGLLRSGTNTLGAIVAEGWYSGYVGYGLLVGYGPGRTGRDFYGKTPALRAQLEVEFDDGTRLVLGTDPSWQVSGDGPIREADLIMGESFDARRERPDWCSPHGAPDWTWEPAIRAEDNPRVQATFHDTLGPREVDLGFRAPPRLQAYAAPPIRVTQELPARRLTEPQPGVYLFDLGQNIAGIVRLKVRGPAGTRLQLRHGEMLHPDGRLMTENLRRARATDFYILRGDPDGETWQPRFTYHGFQYVEITGLPSRPDLDAVTGLVLHNDTLLTGEFACSDEVMTRFWKNTQWTQRANFIEMPTDCPQRDERLGWMGDAQVYVRAATCNADVAAFFTKWLDDVAEAQRDFGAYPDYCPYPMAHGAPGQTFGTAWTDAGIICPWTLWKVYGDTRLLERQWPSMTRFMDWRQRRAPDLKGRGDGNTWGDWLNAGETTPIEFIDAAYFKFDADLMADMAAALGRTDEAQRYRHLATRIAATWTRDYLDTDQRLKVDSQTAHVLALAFELAPAGARPALAARLADKIVRNGHRMTTGFLGTRDLLPVLSRHGHHDLALRVFQGRRFPSWAYEVINGATTVWERWDSYTREFGFNGADGNQNASMNSFSHYAFGAITAWMFRDLAGIDTDGPGFRRVRLHPGPPSARSPFKSASDVPEVHWARADYHSPRGPIRSAWRVEGDRFLYDITVPANTTAEVWLPAAGRDGIRENNRPLAQVPEIRWLRQEPGRAVLETGSGSYQFESTLPQ